MSQSTKKLSLFILIENVLELFTKKDFKWQIENNDTVPYTESEKRLSWLLLLLSVISIVTCTSLAIFLDCEHEAERVNNSTNSYYIEKTGN